MAGRSTEMLCCFQYKKQCWFTNGEHLFLGCCVAFTGRGTYFETRYKWKESMKQLLHLCGTWQQQQWKRCIRLPFSVLFHWAASPAFLQPVKLPWQQSEESSWGTVKRNVQWCKEITKGINSATSLPRWQNVYNSGKWPGLNSNLKSPSAKAQSKEEGGATQ